TMGETSGTAVRALSLGRLIVVNDTGWFGELPDDVARKIPVDEHEADAIAAALELLASESSVRDRMGAAALRLAQSEHSLDHVAEAYVAAIEESAGGP